MRKQKQKQNKSYNKQTSYMKELQLTLCAWGFFMQLGI